MKKSDGIELSITGTFNFSINQHGLNYYNPEELKYAIEDFWNEFEKSRDVMNGGHNVLDIQLEWDNDDLQIEPS